MQLQKKLMRLALAFVGVICLFGACSADGEITIEAAAPPEPIREEPGSPGLSSFLPLEVQLDMQAEAAGDITSPHLTAVRELSEQGVDLATVDSDVVATAVANISAGLPLDASVESGLYGGTAENTCNVERLIQFLIDQPDKGHVWADVQGIDFEDLPDFIRSLTPTVLDRDVTVLNHGFDERGFAIPIVSTLAAGTAVLVDDNGDVRTRCYCGNPILPYQASEHEPPQCLTFVAVVYQAPNKREEVAIDTRSVRATNRITSYENVNWLEIRWSGGTGWVRSDEAQPRYCKPNIEEYCVAFAEVLSLPNSDQKIGVLEDAVVEVAVGNVEGWALVKFGNGAGWVLSATLGEAGCNPDPECIETTSGIWTKPGQRGQQLGSTGAPHLVEFTGQASFDYSGSYKQVLYADVGRTTIAYVRDGDYVGLGHPDCKTWIRCADFDVDVPVYLESSGAASWGSLWTSRVSIVDGPDNGRYKIDWGTASGWVDAQFLGDGKCPPTIACIQIFGEIHDYEPGKGGTRSGPTNPVAVAFTGEVFADGTTTYREFRLGGVLGWLETQVGFNTLNPADCGEEPPPVDCVEQAASEPTGDEDGDAVPNQFDPHPCDPCPQEVDGNPTGDYDLDTIPNELDPNPCDKDIGVMCFVIGSDDVDPIQSGTVKGLPADVTGIRTAGLLSVIAGPDSGGFYEVRLGPGGPVIEMMNQNASYNVFVPETGYFVECGPGGFPRCATVGGDVTEMYNGSGAVFRVGTNTPTEVTLLAIELEVNGTWYAHVEVDGNVGWTPFDDITLRTIGDCADDYWEVLCDVEVTGNTVTVSATTPYPSNTSLTSLAWDFGDGGTATGQSATHTWNPKPRTVRLTATRDDGQTSTTVCLPVPTCMIAVGKGGPADPRIVDSTVNGGIPRVDIVRQFDGLPSSTWFSGFTTNWGDGTAVQTTSGWSPYATKYHSYTAPGTYVVTVTYLDPHPSLLITEATCTVTINPAPTSETAEVAADETPVPTATPLPTPTPGVTVEPTPIPTAIPDQLPPPTPAPTATPSPTAEPVPECQYGEDADSGRCLELCAVGEININGLCTCPAGSTLQAGFDGCWIDCTNGKQNVSATECACPNGTVDNGVSCSAIECPAGTVLNNATNSCDAIECPAGTVLNNATNSCDPAGPSCEAGYSWDGSACVSPTGACLHPEVEIWINSDGTELLRQCGTVELCLDRGGAMVSPARCEIRS